MAITKTLTFSEDNKGWTSFWSYEPLFMFSIAGTYYSVIDNSLHEHYSPSSRYSQFYGEQYDSEVTLLFNENPSMVKSFKTLNYEGTDGWEMTTSKTDEYSLIGDSQSDIASPIKSYSEGEYISRGVEYRVGFDKRENKYFANIVNDGVTLREREVITGDGISGVKGFFLEVTLSTDETTNIGGAKQLVSVASEYAISSM